MNKHLFSGWFRSRPAVAASLVVALILAAAAWRLSAQDAAPGGFKSYPLKHATPEDMEAQLRQVLPGGGKWELAIDRNHNALMLRGDADAQRIAAQLVAALDKPAPKADGKDKSSFVVRGYRLPAGNNDKLLADLKKQFPASTGVTLSIDKRTGQLLALAPPDVQRKLVAQLGDAANGEPQLGGPRAPQDRTIVQREDSLKNISWQGLENLLGQLWKSKATMETNRTGDIASFKLKNLAGDDAIARIDRRRNEVVFEGPRTTASEWAKLVSILDSAPNKKRGVVQLVPVHQADPEQINEAIDLIKLALQQPSLKKNETRTAKSVFNGHRPQASDMIAKIFQQEGGAQPAAQPAPMAEGAPGGDEAPIGPVRIEFLQDIGTIIITGKKEDVERVTKIIQEIEDQAKGTVPVIELYRLRHVDSTALAELVVALYNESLAARYGRVSITPLDKPNSLIFIGTQASITAALDLVKKLDQPASPDAEFKVIPLRYMSAADASLLLTEFMANREPSLSTKIQFSSDVRTNSIIVHASPRDIVEVERVLAKLDVSKGEAESVLRVFPLKNAYAADLAQVLQSSIATQAPGTQVIGQQAQPGGQQGQPGQQNQPQNLQGATTQNQQPTSSVSFEVIDRRTGQKVVIDAPLLSSLRITADTNANALIVRGPSESMDLIAALVYELDRLPNTEGQIKVFTIINGDATALQTMLQTLFGQAAQGGQQGFPTQALTTAGENVLVPLRFSVDSRTNSIIASGASGDLAVVEAILSRLDEGDIRQRKTTVYRLKNAPAMDVSNSINQFLQQQRAVLTQINPSATSPFEQLEREVVVVPEIVSNSLIVSATPRFYDEIARVVESLDARPPMVTIQVLIAEVSLNDFEEFGAEFGLQDALLFDRSVINNAVAAPGYAFNNAALANVGTNPRLSNNLAGQSLTNFAMGRTNGNLGYGGLVLAASNESISILIRALQDAQRLQVLSRPQVTTLDNQSAFVQVGQRVPYAQGTNNSVNGFSTQTTLINVGLLLGVTPRISPDGLVVMEIDAEKSDLAPGTGITIGIGADGTPITQPIINTTLAQTTVSARSGQTVILGGLITKTRSYSSRRIPYLSDVPILGRIFRYDSSTEERTELLIIMTPHIVRNEADADWVKQVESDRMSWCLADVVEIHGDAGLSGGNGLWGPAIPPPIYPDVDPTGMGGEWIEPGFEMPPPRRGPTTPSGRQGAYGQPLNPPVPAPTHTPNSTVTPVPVDPSLPQTTPPKADGAKPAPLPNPFAPQPTPNQSSRKPPMTPPTPQPQLKPANEKDTAYLPQLQTGQHNLRVEQSDNATVYYADPRPRPLPAGPQPYGPQPYGAQPLNRATGEAPEVAPAYYEQPKPQDGRIGGGAYPTRQANYPRR
jgi:type II secretion system protein D